MQLYRESQEANSKHPVKDVKMQLPFFCCPNFILDSDSQIDISKFIYCKEVGIPPHEGEYGIQPGLWIQKFWTIKEALNIREQIQTEKIRNENGSK